MKKIITLTICLALICSSVAPVFGAETITFFMDGNTSTRVSAYEVMISLKQNVNYINNKLDLMKIDLSLIEGYIGQAFGTPLSSSTYWTFWDLADDVHNVAAEFEYAQNINPGNYSMVTWLYTAMDTLVGQIAPDVNSILSEAGLIDYYTQANNTKLINVDQDLEKYFGWKPWLTSYNEGRDWYQDYYLVDSDNGNWGDISTERDKYTTDTSKIDFILRLLQALNFNQAKEYSQLYTDVDSQLSIWDSQGNTLSQTYWTPTSGFNGLYKYLAYTQRDVARLTHVYASDEEIAARDAARQNQTAVVNNFVDGNGVGSVSASDLGDMASVSGSLQSNFDTGASVSSVFAFFSNGSSTNWFSQATADALDTSNGSIPGDPDPDHGVDFSINPTRNNSSNTPLLDAYYEEIYDLLGIGDDNR